MQNQQQMGIRANTKLNSMEGRLKLSFEDKGGKTTLSHCHHTSPLKASKALYLNDDATATVYLMETSGGMVEGDQNNYEIIVNNNSNVILIPQSSTKIYPARFNLSCKQNIKITVGEYGTLRWLPETIIPFADSIFEGNTSIHLDLNSSLIFSEIFSSGRQKSQESFKFDRFSSKTKIYVDEELIIYDHLNLNNAPVHQLGMFEECSYMALLWCFNTNHMMSKIDSFTEGYNHGKTHRFGYTSILPNFIHFRWLSNDLCLLKEQMNNVISFY